MKTRTLVVGWMLAATLVGCSAGAQVVRQDAYGGELVTWGPIVPASEEAREHMVGHCAGRYTVTDEALRTQDDTRRVTYACDRELAMLRGSAATRLAIETRTSAVRSR